MSGFWDHLPSLVTEILSGLVFVAAGVLTLLCAALWPVQTVAALATVGSLVYELKFDANPEGKLRDLTERQLGIIAGCIVYALVR